MQDNHRYAHAYDHLAGFCGRGVGGYGDGGIDGLGTRGYSKEWVGAEQYCVSTV